MAASFEDLDIAASFEDLDKAASSNNLDMAASSVDLDLAASDDLDMAASSDDLERAASLITPTSLVVDIAPPIGVWSAAGKLPGSADVVEAAETPRFAQEKNAGVGEKLSRPPGVRHKQSSRIMMAKSQHISSG